MTGFADPPPNAAWRHLDAREGFEVAWFAVDGNTITIEGATSAVQEGALWTVRYSIRLDPTWVTRHAQVHTRTVRGEHTTELVAVEPGVWNVDGRRAPHLDGCQRYGYEAPAFGFTAQIDYDEHGLVVDYPGIARRVPVSPMFRA